MTGDERSENEEEEEGESSQTEDEGVGQHKLGNGHAVDEKEDKSGCFGCLSPPKDICRSKTVYWLKLSTISTAEDVRNQTMLNLFIL